MKFPHTKAQLAAIARHYKPTDFDNDDDNDEATRHVVGLLTDEDEDGLKRFLKESYAVDDDAMEQCVLDLMHKHRDDVAGVPFLFLTPTRRPISRPSSRASMTSSRLHPARPETPSSAPASPLVHVFRRPHTPATSPLAPGITSARSDYSPSSSPILSHAAITHHVSAQYTASLPASPLSSPRLLNAKANEFRPIPRPLSAAATTPGSLIRNDTPPPDMWAHNSPRATSNLAIAAPLIADQYHPLHHSPTGASFTRSLTPSSGLRSSYGPKDDVEEDDTDDIFSANNPIPSFHSITISDYDQYDPWTNQQAGDQGATTTKTATGGSGSGAEGGTTTTTAPFPIMYGPWGPPDANDYGPLPPHPSQLHQQQHHPMAFPLPLPHQPAGTEEDILGAGFTDGMTPFDVLSSVFGSTLAPSELEEALAVNGYDFDRAMAWLVDRAMPPGQSQNAATTQVGSQSPPGGSGRMQHLGAGVTLVSRQGLGIRGGLGGGRGYANVGGVTGSVGNGTNNGTSTTSGPRTGPGGGPPPRYVNGRPVPSGNRVCRYFVAGECLRADCRFSHDLERALCRFWLRGTCAKGETCEFLHHLPKDVDVNALSGVLARANVAPGQGPFGAMGLVGGQMGGQGGMHEEFPALGYEGANGGMGGPGAGVNGGRRGSKYGAYDPGRTRFAAAVKKPAMPLGAEDMNGHASTSSNNNGGSAIPPSIRRDIVGGPSADNLHHQSAIVAPRPSPRLKLRPPTLLPTLPTGESVSALYMSYRSRALQLGGARNACLSRAADAWRRGDGAAAKRFSREGHDLNAKMSVEMAEAAKKLVRERARVAEGAVRARDASWSDEPGDRTARGKSVGGGLGVCLGIASASAVASATAGPSGKNVLSPEERTEVMLDLHGLHSNEATEVLETFLLSLEREHFFGLAYAIVGEEKHTGNQDPSRGVSRARLATGVREWLHKWGYPWSDRDGIICIDPLTHASE